MYVVDEHLGVKPGSVEQPQPRLQPEPSGDMPIEFDAHPTGRLDRVHEHCLDGRVGGVRVMHVFEEGQVDFVATRRSVQRLRWPEGLAILIWRADKDAAALQVRPRCCERCAEVILREHVRDRVVYQHGVERSFEPHLVHIAKVVLDPRIQAFGVREHPRRDVNGGGLKAIGKVR